MRTAVIGGGPAGLMAAIAAAGNRSAVVLFEKMPSPGQKLRLTGNGRCNVTYNADVRDFAGGILSGARFMTKALYAFPPEAVCRFFEDLGVPLKTQDDGRVFPASDRADDILEALLKRATALGVEIRAGESVEQIRNAVGGGFAVHTKSGIYAFDTCVLCTGGLSYPSTGSTGDGYRISAAFGHPMIPPHPGLAPIRLREQNATDSPSPEAGMYVPAGVALRGVGTSVLWKDKTLARTKGDLLFTHVGVSGPGALLLSRSLPTDPSLYEKDDIRFCVQVFPDVGDQEFDLMLREDIAKNPNRSLLRAIRNYAPEAYLLCLIEKLGFARDKVCRDLRREERLRLAQALRTNTFTVAEPPRFQEAMITAGGVDIVQVNPKTMESKIVPGLFFAGEILDVDAVTGGYNLQIAFATGFVAGQSAAGDREETKKKR